MAEFDTILVGSGFACSFFLRKRLQMSSTSAKFLVLERGPLVQHADQIADRRNSPITTQSTFRVVMPKGLNQRKLGILMSVLVVAQIVGGEVLPGCCQMILR